MKIVNYAEYKHFLNICCPLLLSAKLSNYHSYCKLLEGMCNDPFIKHNVANMKHRLIKENLTRCCLIATSFLFTGFRYAR